MFEKVLYTKVQQCIVTRMQTFFEKLEDIMVIVIDKIPIYSLNVLSSFGYQLDN